ncbi:MAG TPA: GNAT family N-acetyltransferase [Ktedonobacterales bacterium]|nr:GNAT family N-acetyltransferase [Ktedonobacterales bacterium]
MGDLSTLSIHLLKVEDIPTIAAAFAALGWDKPAEQYKGYLEEQQRGERVALVAWQADEFVGYVTIVWVSSYAPFREATIPEINDFNVLPHARRQGIGSRLMDEAERRIAERSPVVGIGVGLYADYGAAQRMYAKRGYIPDGRGITAHERRVTPGDSVVVDDDLVLWFTKAF